MLFFCITPLLAVDDVQFERNGVRQKLVGKVLVAATDGGLLLQTPDGVLWDLKAGEVKARRSDDAPFKLLTAEEQSEKLLGELGAGFQVRKTAHYVICHNTSKHYADWCGSLLERLNRAFFAYWDNKGFKLAEPKYPLVALVFADQASYVKYAETELGDSATNVLGYYSLRTNRVTMYDLTGVQVLRQEGAGRGSPEEINRLLSDPKAERIVATIIHEATHQLAFNSGLHARYADIPLWFSEGVATYFETPDLASVRGWNTIGAVNPVQHARFKDYLTRRPAGSLANLLADASRFRNGATQEDAYAEAWALTYFLARTKPDLYHKYLRQMAAKSPLVLDTPEDRIRDFRLIFGADVGKFDAEFVRWMEGVK